MISYCEKLIEQYHAEQRERRNRELRARLARPRSTEEMLCTLNRMIAPAERKSCQGENSLQKVIYIV